MFCKPPLITESNTLLLQTHLLNKPFRAKSIKTLRLHLDSGINTTTQLIHLPTCIIAQGSREEFSNLKSISPAYEFGDVYRKTLLLFKDSIEDIYISHWEEENGRASVDQLREFKQSFKIILNGKFQDLPCIKSVVGKARRLQGNELANCYLSEDDGWSNILFKTLHLACGLEQMQYVAYNISLTKIAEPQPS